MKSGVQVGFMEVPEDIAARKKAEEEAARKKAKYAQLIGPFNAFPAKLQKDCATVMGKLLYTDELNKSNPFFAQYNAENEWYRVFSEEVRIPYRISYEDSDEIYAHLEGEQAKRIYSCIFTRHLDGHIREKHLRKLLSGSIPEWCLPYLLRLSGEYLVELLQPIYDAYHLSAGGPFDRPYTLVITLEEDTEKQPVETGEEPTSDAPVANELQINGGGTVVQTEMSESQVVTTPYTASTLSQDDVTIVLCVACAVIFGLGGFFLGKKKKPALEDGAST